MKVANLFASADTIELRYCLALNRTSHYRLVRSFFGVVSRLGDGVLWYALILTLPVLQGAAGLGHAMHVLCTGILCLVIYKALKTKLVRERPYISDTNILRAAPALDRYSFPSGHTMHAVSFSVCLSYYMPEIAVIVWGFTLLVGLSRVVLGLHYPSDVAFGAVLGYCVGTTSLYFTTISPDLLIL